MHNRERGKEVVKEKLHRSSLAQRASAKEQRRAVTTGRGGTTSTCTAENVTGLVGSAKPLSDQAAASDDAQPGGKNLIDVESRRVAKKWSPEAAEGRRTGNLGYVEDVRGSRYSTER